MSDRMEGYFGPREDSGRRSDTSGYDYDDWALVNEEAYRSRISGRPRQLDLSSSRMQRQKFHNVIPETPEEEDVVKYMRIGFGLVTLVTEHLLSHPFVVIRRQCQVNQSSLRYHILPLTLVPVVIHLHQQQGPIPLWKGLGSCLVIQGMALAVEDILSKITPWPKEISWSKQSVKTVSQHILLKCVTFAIITPFYSASLVETVQSDIASEKPGIFDVFKEGFSRIACWNYPKRGRMLPVWNLIVPTVVYSVLKYLFSKAVKNLTFDIMLLRQKQEEETQVKVQKDWSESNNHDIKATSQIISLIVTEMVFFPLETILHRLHLQGTRTIIDNFSSDYSHRPLVAILTNYEGALDCYKKSVSQEGPLGLYKGFGALLLQLTAYTAVIKITKFVLTQISYYVSRQPSPPPQPLYVPTPTTSFAQSPHDSLPRNFQDSYKTPR